MIHGSTSYRTTAGFARRSKDRVPPKDGLLAARHRAGALSIRNSTTFLGRSVDPVLFAGLAVTTGYRTLLLAAGVIALASGVGAVIAGKSAGDRPVIEEIPVET